MESKKRIEPLLKPDETLLWAGKPETKLLFGKGGLIIFIVGVYWLFNYWRIRVGIDSHHNVEQAFLLWDIMFKTPPKDTTTAEVCQ